MDFANELDALITRAKAAGCDLGEMAADLEDAAEGLNDEVRGLATPSDEDD